MNDTKKIFRILLCTTFCIGGNGYATVMSSSLYPFDFHPGAQRSESDPGYYTHGQNGQNSVKFLKAQEGLNQLIGFFSSLRNTNQQQDSNTAAPPTQQPSQSSSSSSSSLQLSPKLTGNSQPQNPTTAPVTQQLSQSSSSSSQPPVKLLNEKPPQPLTSTSKPKLTGNPQLGLFLRKCYELLPDLVKKAIDGNSGAIRRLSVMVGGTTLPIACLVGAAIHNRYKDEMTDEIIQQPQEDQVSINSEGDVEMIDVDQNSMIEDIEQEQLQQMGNSTNANPIEDVIIDYGENGSPDTISSDTVDVSAQSDIPVQSEPQTTIESENDIFMDETESMPFLEDVVQTGEEVGVAEILGLGNSEITAVSTPVEGGVVLGEGFGGCVGNSAMEGSGCGGIGLDRTIIVAGGIVVVAVTVAALFILYGDSLFGQKNVLLSRSINVEDSEIKKALTWSFSNSTNNFSFCSEKQKENDCYKCTINFMEHSVEYSKAQPENSKKLVIIKKQDGCDSEITFTKEGNIIMCKCKQEERSIEEEKVGASFDEILSKINKGALDSDTLCIFCTAYFNAISGQFLVVQ